MFEGKIRGFKAIVFDIDDTLLIWNSYKDWYDTNLGIARSFIADEEWDLKNGLEDVYAKTQVNIAAKAFIKEVMQYNKDNKFATKEIYALSADDSTFAMINKSHRLKEDMPEVFNEDNILWCSKPEDKIHKLDILCAMLECTTEQILIIDDTQSVLIEADKNRYGIMSTSELMQTYISNLK